MARLEIDPSAFEPPMDPLTCATEDWQESDEYSKGLQAVAQVKVDDVDIAPFSTRDIPLSEVVGADAAIDVAAEGMLIGFEAGFRYGQRGSKHSRELITKALDHIMRVSKGPHIIIEEAGKLQFAVAILRSELGVTLPNAEDEEHFRGWDQEDLQWPKEENGGR